jgi:hypothetical protein
MNRFQGFCCRSYPSPVALQVLQEYVHDLLLLQGHKCHIRAHVLVSGAVHVSIAEQCLVLPAVATFDADAGDDALVHATNHALWSKHKQTSTHTLPTLAASFL